MTATRVDVRAFATVEVPIGDGWQRVRVLGIGQRWVSVERERADGLYSEVWRPDQIEWGGLQPVDGCDSIRVTLPDGRRHELTGSGAAWTTALRRWVARALVVGAVVDSVVVVAEAEEMV